MRTSLLKNTIKSMIVLSFFYSPVYTYALDSTQENSVYWLFPGETLPGERSILPMSIGTGADYDVNLQKRDWLSLKSVESVYAHQVDSDQNISNELGYIGPKLNSYNAQMYYRLMTGLILKESLKQMGLSGLSSRRYYDSVLEKGLDFEKTPLSEMGPLPPVLQNLYINFKRPVTRQAFIPYLLMPLAVAHHQSDFRHFLETENKSDFNKVCKELDSFSPLLWTSSEYNSKKAEIEKLNREYEDVLALLKRSKLESVRLTELLNKQTSEQTFKTNCLNSLKDRINSGSKMPSTECLDSLKEEVVSSSGKDVWERFENKNLTNETGDFIILQKSEEALNEIKAKINAENQKLVELEKTKTEVETSLKENKVSLHLLKESLSKKKEEVLSLDNEYKVLKANLSKIQKLNFDLDQGTLQNEKSDVEILKLISETPQREKEIIQIKGKLVDLLKAKNAQQALIETLDAQINFLVPEIEKQKHFLSILENQNKKEEAVSLSPEKLEALKLEKTELYRQALDNYRYSEYIVSIFSKNIFEIDRNKELTTQSLENEKAASLDYATKAKELESLKLEELPKKEMELASLSNFVEAYTSHDKMGWYLSPSCSQNAKGESTFISRALIESKEETSLNGKWGAFNLDYNNYPNLLNAGLPLNTKKYIAFSVQKIIEHYDFMNQNLFSDKNKCLKNSDDLNLFVTDLIAGAYSMWTSGVEASSKNKGFCNLKGQDVSLFKETFKNLVKFEGSLLDLVLPKAEINGKALSIERDAIVNLTQELSLLATDSRGEDLEKRRDDLIKSLIKVLANNYTKEFQEKGPESKERRSIQIASEAPSSELYKKADLSIGSTYKIKTIGQISLYNSPIAQQEYETNVTLSLNDEVKVLPISPDFPNDAIKSKWVRVEVVSERFKNLAGRYFWMTAWPLTQTSFVKANGEDIYKSIDQVDCPLKRTVSELTNFKSSDFYVTRLLPEIKTKKYSRNTWQMSWGANKKTSPAYTNKNEYIACEIFKVPGQKAASLEAGDVYLNKSGVDYSEALGVRIIAVSSIRDVNGKKFYVPLETYGGFVHTWIFSRNKKQPRIVLGESLDKDWSPAQ